MGQDTDSKAADVAAAALAAQQHGLITRSQALALGMSSAGIQRRVRSGRWEFLRRGVYGFAGTPNTRRREILEACLGAGDAGLAADFTAAEVWALPDIRPRDRVTVSLPPGVRRRVKGATVTRGQRRKAQDDRDAVDAIPVTSVARTYVDVAARLPVRVLERSIVQAIRKQLVTPEQLREAVSRGGPPEAVERLERILEAEAWQHVFRSGAEIDAVQFLRAAGFDDIRTNVEIKYAGIRIGEADVLLSQVETIFEIDGPRDHSTPWAKRRDKVRRLAYQALGYRVVAIHPDRFKDPGDVANLLTRALEAPAPRRVTPLEFRRLWAEWVEKYGDPNDVSEARAASACR